MLNFSDLKLIQTAGCFLPVTTYKWNGSAFIKKFKGAFYLVFFKGKAFGNYDRVYIHSNKKYKRIKV